MEDLIQAFISFITDFFAALVEFLGSKSSLGNILGNIQNAVGGETTTAASEE